MAELVRNVNDGGQIDLRDEVERLRKLVYVPGLWQCAKCNFQLVQSNLNVGDGTITARDTPGDKCPNCNGPLWRVAYRDAYREMMAAAEAQCMEVLRLRQALGAHIQADAYRDDVPDNTHDAAYLRKQETWWRLTARGWLAEDDARVCARDAKDRAARERGAG
jgi:hypothetical protein